VRTTDTAGPTEAQRVEFSVEGMTCASHPGAEDADETVRRGRGAGQFRDRHRTRGLPARRVHRIGYQLEPVTPTQPAHGDEENERERRTWLRRVWLAWPLGLAVFVLTMVFGDLTWARWAAFAVTVPVQFVAG
jgi:cation transport ATPase